MKNESDPKTCSCGPSASACSTGSARRLPAAVGHAPARSMACGCGPDCTCGPECACTGS